MNLPNKLTISRFFLTVIFIIVILKPGLTPKIWAAIFFTLASLTDFLDGYYAKKYSLTSNFGKIMDPIADKFLMLTAFFIFVHLGIIPGWMFVVIAIREIAITVWRLVAMRRGKVMAAERLGKYKTVAQIVSISFILLFLILDEGETSTALLNWFPSFIYFLMLITVGLTAVSGVDYVFKNKKGRYA